MPHHPVAPAPRGRRSTLRRSAAAIAVGIALAATVAPAAGAAEPAPSGSGATVVAEGLSSPRGLDSFLGVPIVGQGAFGPPGPVVAAIRLP